MGQANVLYELDYPMCPGTLGMGLAKVHWEGDYTICHGNGTSQCAQ